MSSDRSQRVMDRYFELMGRDADFSSCFTKDVTWSVVDTGAVITGPEPVRDYIVDLHAGLLDWQSRTFVVGEDHVFLEGDAATADGGTDRAHYCVAYDLDGELIAAMRCYGPGAARRATAPGSPR